MTANVPEGVALVVLGPSGLALAETLKPLLPGSEIHGLEGRVAAEVTFFDVTAHMRDLFQQFRPIVGVCAAGILIRALSGVLDLSLIHISEPTRPY